MAGLSCSLIADKEKRSDVVPLTESEATNLPAQEAAQANADDFDPFAEPPKKAKAKAPPQNEAPPEQEQPERERDEHGRFIPKKPSAPMASASHPRGLAAMARDLGVPDEQIQGMTTEHLDNLVFHLNQQRFTFLENERTRTAQSERQQQPVEEPEPDIGMEEADYDPKLVAAMKKLAKENQALRKEFKQLNEQRISDEQRRRDESIDDAFLSLPANRQAIYGSGRIGALTPAELARRNAVLAIAQHQRGSIKQKIQQADNILYGDHPEQPPAAQPTNGSAYVEEELAKRRESWPNAPVARPTSRASEGEPPSLKKARDSFKKRMREMEDANEDSNDEFPG